MGVPTVPAIEFKPHRFLKGSEEASDHPAGEEKGSLFDAQRAAYYLDLDTVRTLEIFERDYGLVGQVIGKKKFYHRIHLDNAARRACGIKPYKE